MNKLFGILSLFILSLFLIGCQDESDVPSSSGQLSKNSSFSAEYEITIENLAPAGSQPLSPPVFAVHSNAFRMFHIGGYATDELAQIAQDAFNDPMITLLNGSDDVFDVVVGAGPIPPGASATFNAEASGNYIKLSFATMLVNTNDGFTGVDKLQLPQQGTKVYYLRAYDAGSELNTESDDHIPGPCCGNPFAGISTNEKIAFHPGIEGVGDLSPAVYGWDEPVAKLTITRL